MPAIRFIVITHTSASDGNGNRYHFARVTSTATGKSLTFESGGEENAQHMVGRAIGDHCYPSIYALGRTIPKKQWRGMVRDAEKNNGGSLPHTVTSETILALETGDAE